MIERKKDYLFVRFAEPYQFERAIAFMKEVGEVCRQEKFSKVLVDLNGGAEISLMEGFRLGSTGAETFRSLAKVAVVSQSVLIQFVETVGINRGGNVRMFTELEKARKWLDVEE